VIPTIIANAFFLPRYLLPRVSEDAETEPEEPKSKIPALEPAGQGD
jgi:hypothetical protein